MSYDLHFGKVCEGTPRLLVDRGAALGLDVAIVAPLFEGSEAISSSAIRAALSAGDIAKANRLLGHDWFVVGEVVHGEKRGRALGFPTANMRLEADCGLRHGIYAVRAVIGGIPRPAVASFGRRPTFDNGAALLETFIFDFEGDLYGHPLEVSFAGWIRSEERFETAEALVLRMQEDSRIARIMTGMTG